MMKKVVVATRKMTGMEMRTRRRTNLITGPVLGVLWIGGALSPAPVNADLGERMVVHRRCVDAAHVGLDEVVAGVCVNGNDGEVFQQNRLAPLEQVHAPRRVRFVSGESQQVIVLRVLPAGVVVAVIALQQLSERAAVGVIPDPAGASDIVFQVVARFY